METYSPLPEATSLPPAKHYQFATALPTSFLIYAGQFSLQNSTSRSELATQTNYFNDGLPRGLAAGGSASEDPILCKDT